MEKYDRWIILRRRKRDKGMWFINDPESPFYTSRVAAEREADALIRRGYDVEVAHLL